MQNKNLQLTLTTSLTQNSTEIFLHRCFRIENAQPTKFAISAGN